MTGIEQVVAGLLIGLTVGIVIGAVLMDVLVVQPLNRRSRSDRTRLLRAQTKQTVNWPTHSVPTGKPGLRLVDGEVRYSSEWLNDKIMPLTGWQRDLISKWLNESPFERQEIEALPLTPEQRIIVRDVIEAAFRERTLRGVR